MSSISPPNSLLKVLREKAIKKKITLKPQPAETFYGPVSIFFGSQTGTAASYAKLLGEEAVKNGFKPKLIDLIDFDPEYLQTLKLTIFVMATHGEGEPTDNSKTFNEWLSDPERTGQELKGQKFAVFGMGNKQYQFYNAQGKKVNQYLEKLGGER
jgi:NADPH-ferrihemoprotein reductase